jgi:hypothetical protein
MGQRGAVPLRDQEEIEGESGRAPGLEFACAEFNGGA